VGHAIAVLPAATMKVRIAIISGVARSEHRFEKPLIHFSLSGKPRERREPKQQGICGSASRIEHRRA